jgi:DNA-binding CsgD family transcriptional regulator
MLKVPRCPRAGSGAQLHPQEKVDEALRLKAQGLTGWRIAKVLDLPRSTVENWIRGVKRAEPRPS